jgi:hypothetical protein
MTERSTHGLRRHLTYANVMATITAFVVLAGGTAFAANQLAKNSVGRKQLKANAVTTAKIKKNAVTARKIRAGAVDGSKVKDGSLGEGDLDLASMPYSRIVHKARGSTAVAIGETLTIVPLGNPTYTQPPGEDDFFYGALDVTFQPGCEQPRDVDAFLVVDSPNPVDPAQGEIMAAGHAEDEAGGTVTKQLKLGATGLSGSVGGALFQPDAATGRTLALVASLECKAGSGATASNPAVDVIGVR